MAWDQKEITAYLVDVDTGDYLDFQYNPNDIVDEKSTAYAAIKIPGMSHPALPVRRRGAAQDRLQGGCSRGPVKESVDWLRSLLYPEHAGTMLKNAPHRVIFMFGDLYPGVLCVVRQVKARFFHMFDRDNLLPQHAEVDVVLEEYIDQSVDCSEVRS